VIHDSTPSPPPSVGPPQTSAAPSVPRAQVELRPTGQPRTINDTLAGLSLQPLGEAVRKRHHTEILARMTDGRSVYVSFDLSGRLWEIEDASHDRQAVPEAFMPLTDAELLQKASEAGFAPEAFVERRKHHSVIAARNTAGEPLELHLDRRGYIFKQVWRY
jgi:hypothetical protein